MGTLIAGLTKQTITSISNVTRDGYGDETASVLYSSVPCRWTEKTTQVTTPESELKLSKISVWLSPDYSIEYDYVLVKGGVTYKILSIDKKYDLGGNLDHSKIYLQ